MRPVRLRLGRRTNVAQGAIAATGLSGEATVTAEKHERVVRSNFLLRCEFFLHGLVGFFGRFGFDDLEAVENPVDVRVHSDVGQVVEYG